MIQFINFLFLFFLIGSLSAQEYIFDRITTQQGLSQNDVNCVFQDHHGFLWIGTNDGLNRYDGYSFRTFRIDDKKQDKGLSSNLIYKIKEDKKGRIWIATSNEGVCVFDSEKEIFTQIRNTSINPIRLASNRVLDLECMEDNTVWVATEKGVTIVSEVKGVYVTINLNSIAISPLVSKGCNVVTEDEKGRRWLGFYKGLVLCENGKNSLKVTPIKGFESMNVRSILRVPNGFLIGTGSGLFFFQEANKGKKENKLIEINSYPTVSVYLDDHQNLYVSSQIKLLVYSCDFIKQEFKLKSEVQRGDLKSDLSSNMVMSIYGDSSGIIWIGTNGGGLNKYNPKRKKINHYKSTGLPGSVSSNKIRAILEDSNHNIWIGTEGGELII